MDAVFTEPAVSTPSVPLTQRERRHLAAVTRHHAVLARRTAAAKTRFLGEYARCGIVWQACQLARVGRRTVFEWQAGDELFAQLMAEALVDAGDYVESVFHKRVIEGVKTPVTIAGKREVVRKYSDALLLARLKAMKPGVYDRDRESGTRSTVIGSQTNNLITPVIPIERLSDAEFKLLERIYGAAGPLIVDVPGPKVVESATSVNTPDA